MKQVGKKKTFWASQTRFKASTGNIWPYVVHVWSKGSFLGLEESSELQSRSMVAFLTTTTTVF
jgi:hypothetical protein